MQGKKAEDTIRLIGCLGELLLIGAVIYAYTFHLYIGIIATIIWLSSLFVFCVPWSLVILELFYPVGRVQKAWFGKDILEPKPSEKPESPNPELTEMIGKTAKAYTDLKPEGMILLSDARIRAKSRLGFVSRDTEVRIVGVKGEILFVDTNIDDHS